MASQLTAFRPTKKMVFLLIKPYSTHIPEGGRMRVGRILSFRSVGIVEL